MVPHFSEISRTTPSDFLESSILHYTRICEDMVERNIAKITMEISEPMVTNVQRDIKVTFVDQLGTIGGTLGLFCGLSIVSMVEFVYWIYKAVIDHFAQ